MAAIRTSNTLVPAAHWRFYSGYVHGLQQPSAVGELHLNIELPIDFDALDEVMARQVVNVRPTAWNDTAADLGDALRIAHRLVYWVCELQRQARIALSQRYRIVRRLVPPSGYSDSFEIAIPVASSEPFRMSVQHVAAIVNRMVAAARSEPLGPGAFDHEAAKLTARLRKHALAGFNRVHMVNAAYRLDMPVRPLLGGIFVFGTGARSHLADSSMTDETSAIGMALSQDKLNTALVLRALGLPAPEHVLVTDEEQAVAQAEKFGYPVVVKPANLDQGKGVAANIRSAQAVRQAFVAARALSARILVERHFDGLGHRLTLHRGELIMVVKRIPGGVVGDGLRTVEQLLERRKLDAEVRRNMNLGRVDLDGEALVMLAEGGMSRDSVPAPGEFVLLRRRDNISAGGTIEFLTPADVHPDNLALARRAARAVHLDLAGVDLLIANIAVSWKVSGALICEVNGMPQFGPGKDGTNFDRVLRAWVGADPRIPVVLYWCPDPPVADHQPGLQALAQRLGLQAVASCRGVWMAHGCHADGFASGMAAARAALFDRDVHSLLVALTPQDVLAAGLPVDRVDAVHAAPAAQWTAEQLAAMHDAMELAGLEIESVHFE